MLDGASSQTTSASGPLLPTYLDVVSIQSQVVYGGVGNTVAVPALQSFGLNVAAIPTVLLSNTPHYPTVSGGVIPASWFAGFLADLIERKAAERLRAVFVGYLGSPLQAELTATWFDKVNSEMTAVPLVIDPVIGDVDTGIYVDPNMIQAYKEHLLPRASGITPNGFELECLTGKVSKSIDDVVAHARLLLAGITQWAVVTSASPDTWKRGSMTTVVVTKHDSHVITHPRVEAVPKGTGDLLSAMVLGHVLQGMSVFEAAEMACTHLVDVVMRCHEQRQAELRGEARYLPRFLL